MSLERVSADRSVNRPSGSDCIAAKDSALIFVLQNLLDAQALDRLGALLRNAKFVDGRQTAGHAVAAIKRNTEIELKSEAHKTCAAIILEALRGSNDFRIVAQPHRIGQILFSRYTEGMEYADHSDNALMGDGGLRTDIAMTVFINQPADYDGGELVMNTDIRPEPYKLPAGHAVVYPAMVLHRVNPVTRGERLVGITWVQSRVRDPQKRQVLVDLALALSHIVAASPKGQGQSHPEYVRLDKVYNNLLRMWVEV